MNRLFFEAKEFFRSVAEISSNEIKIYVNLS